MKEEIVDKYSIVDTLDMCMEEAGELVHALNKYKRVSGLGYETKTSKNDALLRLTQAIADAQNAINSVMYVIGIDEKEIIKEITRADERAEKITNDRKAELNHEKNGTHMQVGDVVLYQPWNILGKVIYIDERFKYYPYLIAFNKDELESVDEFDGFELKKDESYYFLPSSLAKMYDGKFVAFADSKELRLINTSKDIKKNSMKSKKGSQNWGKNKFHREKCSIKNNNAYPETYWIDKNNHDAVNHPSHYCTGGIECIDVIKATSQGMDGIEAFCHGNAMKYLFRWKQKNGLEDLKKARWYIDKLIEIQESSANKKKE